MTLLIHMERNQIFDEDEGDENGVGGICALQYQWVVCEDLVGGAIKYDTDCNPVDKGHWLQTWYLSKILHSQIFRLKVLHRKSA